MIWFHGMIGFLVCFQALKARWHLPYGAVVHPMTEAGGEVPVANPSGGTIIRCKRCRTYINPFMSWMDGGRCALGPLVVALRGQQGRLVEAQQRCDRMLFVAALLPHLNVGA
jgi:hypothetical protein